MFSESEPPLGHSVLGSFVKIEIDNRNSLINMKRIYWKGIKQRIGRFLDKVYDCILIFTDWLG